MGPTGNICALLLSATIISQVQSSEKIDFKSIFHTPQQRKYDDFEILERSSFEPDDSPEPPTHRCITEKPKAIANAQVLVNFDSHKKTPCDRLKQHPLVYLLPQVYHDAFYHPQPHPHPTPVHYHTPQCLQYPGCCYPSPCAARVVTLPCPKLPAKVSKSCIFNLKHEIETLVDPNEMYALAIPELSLQKPQVGLGMVEEIPDCKSPVKGDDEELILVGLHKAIEDAEVKRPPAEEQLILVESSEPKEHLQHVTPGKDNEELILVGVNNVPEEDEEEAEIEGFKQIPSAPLRRDEEIVLVGPVEDEPKIEGFELGKDEFPQASCEGNEELIKLDPSEHESNPEGFVQISLTPGKEASCEGNEELILVGPAEHESNPEGFEQISLTPGKEASCEGNEELVLVGPAEHESNPEGFEQISLTPGKEASCEGNEELVLVGPAEHESNPEGFEQIPITPGKDEEEIILVNPVSGRKDNEEIILVDPVVPKIEGFEKIPSPRKTPISREAQKRILCTIENLVNHLVHDEVNGMQPCEKLRIAEVLTQILINLRNEGGPSAVNEEGLRVFFDFIKKVQDEYSIIQVASRTATPISSLPIPEEGMSKPAALLTQLQSRLLDAKEEKTDEEFASEYTQLLLAYLQTLQEHEDGAPKPVEEVAAQTSALTLSSPPVIVVPGEVPDREEIRKELLDEVQLPLLNQYVVQLNADRENEKPLSNEDVLNFWVNSALQMPRPSQKKKKKKEEKEEVGGVQLNSESKKEEEVKHILQDKPTTGEEEAAGDGKKKEEIISAKPSAQGDPQAKQEGDDHSADLALLLQYLNLLNPGAAPAEVKPPKEVNTGLLRPYVKVEAADKGKEENPQTPKQTMKDPDREEDLLKVNQQVQKEEEFVKVDEPDLPPAQHQVVPTEQPEDVIRVIKGNQQENTIIRIDDHGVPELKKDVDVSAFKQVKEHEQAQGEIIKTNAIIKETEPSPEIIAVKPEAQGQIIKVGGAVEPVDLSLALMKLKQDGNVKGVEEIITAVPLIRKELPEGIIKAELGKEEIVKGDEIIRAKEEVVKAEPPKQRQEDIVKVSDLKGLVSKKEEQLMRVDDLKKENVEIVREPNLNKEEEEEDVEEEEEEALDEFEEIGSAYREEQVIEIGKEKKRGATDGESLEPGSKGEASSPSLNEYLEFLKTKQRDGAIPQVALNKFLEFLKAKQGDLPLLEFMKTAEGRGLPFIAEYLEFAKAKEAKQTLPSLNEYLEFLKTKQCDGAIPQGALDKYLGFLKAKQGDLPLLEFMKTAEGRGLPLTAEFLEFAKAKEGKQTLPSLNEYLEFLKAKQGDGVIPQDAFNKFLLEFLKTKQGDLPLLEFMKTKEGGGLPFIAEYLESAKAKEAKQTLPSLNEYLEFLKTKQCDGATPQGAFLEFLKAKQGDLPFLEFIKTKEGRGLPFIAEYLEFAKAKEAKQTLPSLNEYLEFLKTKQCDGAIPQGAFLEFLKAKQGDLPLLEFMKTEKGRAEYLEFAKARKEGKQAPQGSYLEFTKKAKQEDLERYSVPLLEFAKDASLKDLSRPAEVIEFMKAAKTPGYIQKEEALYKYLNFIGLTSPDEFIEFLKAKGPGEYLSFQEAPSLDAYIEFLRAKGGPHSLDRYVEFMKGKCGPHSLDEYIGFLKAKADHHSLGKYIEFLKAKVDDHRSLDKYVEFLKEKGDRRSLDQYIEFLKAKAGPQTTFSLPQYIQFMKTRPEEEAPRRYLNFKQLSLNAPSLKKYMEFVESKREPPVDRIEYARAPNFKFKLPFLDEYVEFLKTESSSFFSPSGYLEFVKAKSPEEYLNFKKMLSSGDYNEFMKANPPEKYLPSPPRPEEHVEFMKAGEGLGFRQAQPQFAPLETSPQVARKHLEFPTEGSGNLKELTLEDLGDMCKIMDNLEYIKVKLDGLEKAKACQCEPETPSGYEVLAPSYFQGKQKKIFPHDIDDLSRQGKGGSANVFDLVLPQQNIVAILHPQMALSSSSSSPFNTCACGRTIGKGRCPACAPYIKEFNE